MARRHSTLALVLISAAARDSRPAGSSPRVAEARAAIAAQPQGPKLDTIVPEVKHREVWRHTSEGWREASVREVWHGPILVNGQVYRPVPGWRDRSTGPIFPSLTDIRTGQDRSPVASPGREEPS